MLNLRKTIGGVGNMLFKQAYLIGQVYDGVIPDVYVQSEKYWAKHKDLIRGIFREGIGSPIDMVGLQIRRGDYVNNAFYVDLTETNYYQEAVKAFPNESFLVFCHDNQDAKQDADDKEWCKEFLDTFIPGRYQIHRPKTETEDLNDFASCRGKIIANSSFGWWAGFLGDGDVVAPKRWFTDGKQRIDLPDNFIQI